MRISEWSSDVCSSDLKYINYKIPPPEYLVHDDFEIMSLIVINRHPNTAVLGEQFAKQLQPRPYHGQLLAMLQIIVIMLKGRPRIIGRVDIDTFHLPRIIRKQAFQRFQIIALNEHVEIGSASCRERVCQYV